MLALLVASCRGAGAEAEPPPAVPPAEAASPPPPPQAVVPEPPALAAVRSEPVRGRTGPGGQPFEVAVRAPGRAGHHRTIGRRPFAIALRREAPAELVCASCHGVAGSITGPDREPSGHRDVLPRHPEQAGTACRTCHAPDDVEQLVLTGGERVPIGHAYLLCAQCHFAQVDAWAAGVHGKRLDGWLGRRVVMGCADCHDPHQPALEKRTPFPAPGTPRATGRSP